LVHVLCKEGDLTSIKYSAKGIKYDDDDNNNNPDYSKEKGYKCNFIKDFAAKRETGVWVLHFLMIPQVTVILCINLYTWSVKIMFLIKTAWMYTDKKYSTIMPPWHSNIIKTTVGFVDAILGTVRNKWKHKHLLHADRQRPIQQEMICIEPWWTITEKEEVTLVYIWL